MAEDSKIQWTTHTFNPWSGCCKVSDGCKNCYAENLMDKRYHKVIWGPAGTRNRTSESNWKLPYKWDREAKAVGERHRVFCASLADVFEGPDTCQDAPQYAVMEAARRDLFPMIENTPNLDWLLLTKRPQNVLQMVPDGWRERFPTNVWVGVSVENQKAANERIPILGTVPAKVRFLSCEPLLEAVELWRPDPENELFLIGPGMKIEGGPNYVPGEPTDWECYSIPIPDWVIIGGESGPGARVFNLDWARSLVSQCRAASVAPFVKQMGAHPVDGTAIVRYHDHKGGDWDEWPEELQVREFPESHGSAS